MDALFGDATTAMPTPATRAETGSLMGVSSPVPSMDLRRGIYGAGGGGPPDLGPSNAIPGLDIDPPHVQIKNGKPQYSESLRDDAESVSEGVGGWISRMVGRGEQSEASSVRSGQYKPLENEDD
jgi:hypothetical protein